MQRNHRKLLAAAARLGAIPPLLNPTSFAAHCKPDEHATMMLLAYLGKRLLEVSREERAAHVVQCLWRSRHTRLPGSYILPQACTILHPASSLHSLFKAVHRRLQSKAEVQVCRLEYDS